MIPRILTMIPSEGEQWGRDEIYPDYGGYQDLETCLQNKPGTHKTNKFAKGSQTISFKGKSAPFMPGQNFWIL